MFKTYAIQKHQGAITQREIRRVYVACANLCRFAQPQALTIVITFDLAISNGSSVAKNLCITISWFVLKILTL